MKASGVLLVMVVLMSVAFSAGAAPGQSTSQWCDANKDWGMSHDECVSFVKTFPDIVCNDLGNLGMKSHNRCVKSLMSLFP